MLPGKFLNLGSRKCHLLCFLQDIEKNNNTTARNISMVKNTTLQLKRNLKYDLKQQEVGWGEVKGLHNSFLPTTTPTSHNPIGLLKFLIKDCDLLDHRLLPVINKLYRLCKK